MSLSLLRLKRRKLQKEFNLTYETTKALHLIFVITWFSGLFYIVRLFIYHTEADKKAEPERTLLIEQFKIMEKRLWYGITWPSCILVTVFGFLLAKDFVPFSDHGWLLTKFGFLAGLFAYHVSCGRILRNLHNQVFRWSSQQLRIWNEVATVFLVAIVFLAVKKESAIAWKSLVGLFVFTVVLMVSIKAYRKLRKP